jgi:hypothetical protein
MEKYLILEEAETFVDEIAAVRPSEDIYIDVCFVALVI